MSSALDRLNAMNAQFQGGDVSRGQPPQGRDDGPRTRTEKATKRTFWSHLTSLGHTSREDTEDLGSMTTVMKDSVTGTRSTNRGCDTHESVRQRSDKTQSEIIIQEARRNIQVARNAINDLRAQARRGVFSEELEIDETTSQRIQFLEEIIQCEKKISSALKSELCRLQLLNESLAETSNSLTGAKQDLETTNTTLGEHITALEKTNQDKTQESDKLKGEIQALQANKAVLQQQVQAATDEINTLRNEPGTAIAIYTTQAKQDARQVENTATLKIREAQRKQQAAEAALRRIQTSRGWGTVLTAAVSAAAPVICYVAYQAISEYLTQTVEYSG